MRVSRLYLSFVVLLSITVSLVYGGKILIHAVHGEGSHFAVTTAIARELFNRGHNITVLVDDKYTDKILANEKLRFIRFEIYKANFTAAEMDKIISDTTNAGLQGEYVSYILNLFRGTNYIQRLVSECHNLLGDEQLLSNLRKADFDLTIVLSAYLCPIMQYLGKPHVVLSPAIVQGSTSMIAIGSPFNPSYMPEAVTAFDHRMTFSERLKNTIYAIFFNLVAAGFAGPYDSIKHQYNIPEASLAYADAEIWLLNTHFVLDFPKPLLPNTVAVGGFTTKPAQPLDFEWEDFLQSAGDHGVVLFSMGTYARGIDKQIAAMFAEAFSHIPQKVIWKLNDKPSITIPPNVKVVEWMPQNDLLGHPQVKALVYHCGINGLWEAVYHGVPVVAIPLFGDQFDNAQRIASRGMGLKLDITTLTSDELANAIRTVIAEPSYKKTASHMSAIFRDTPRTPIEQVGDWIEYVIRHGGAKHLRSAALDLHILQYFLLDVFSVLLAALIAFLMIAICCCKLCFKGCKTICARSSKVKNE